MQIVWRRLPGGLGRKVTDSRSRSRSENSGATEKRSATQRKNAMTDMTSGTAHRADRPQRRQHGGRRARPRIRHYRSDRAARAPPVHRNQVSIQDHGALGLHCCRRRRLDRIGRRGYGSRPRRLFPGRPGLAVHRHPHHRLPGQPRARQVREPGPLRRVNPRGSGAFPGRPWLLDRGRARPGRALDAQAVAFSQQPRSTGQARPLAGTVRLRGGPTEEVTAPT